MKSKLFLFLIYLPIFSVNIDFFKKFILTIYLPESRILLEKNLFKNNNFLNKKALIKTGFLLCGLVIGIELENFIFKKKYSLKNFTFILKDYYTDLKLFFFRKINEKEYSRLRKEVKEGYDDLKENYFRKIDELNIDKIEMRDKKKAIEESLKQGNDDYNNNYVSFGAILVSIEGRIEEIENEENKSKLDLVKFRENLTKLLKYEYKDDLEFLYWVIYKGEKEDEKYFNFKKLFNEQNNLEINTTGTINFKIYSLVEFPKDIIKKKKELIDIRKDIIEKELLKSIKNIRHKILNKPCQDIKSKITFNIFENKSLKIPFQILSKDEINSLDEQKNYTILINSLEECLNLNNIYIKNKNKLSTNEKKDYYLLEFEVVTNPEMLCIGWKV